MKTLPKIMAIALKTFFIALCVKLIIDNTNPNANLLNQHFVIWIFLYIPIYMGYESLFNLIFNDKKTK